MGFFSQGTNKDIKDVAAGQGALAGTWGGRAAGGSARTEQLWNQEQANQGRLQDLWGRLSAGEFDTPGRAARAVDYGDMAKNKGWWTSLRGGAGTKRLKDTAGKDITSYSEIANAGMMTPAQLQAIRERPASQGRAATAAVLDQMRRGGVTGWGGGGPAGALAAQKNLLSSLRSGNLEAESNIADQTNRERQWGYGQMGAAQGQLQALDDAMRQERIAAASTARQGSRASLGDYLALSDRMGGDWAKGESLTQNALGGQGSALSGWGNTIAGARTPSGFENTLAGMKAVGNLASSFISPIKIGG